MTIKKRQTRADVSSSSSSPISSPQSTPPASDMSSEPLLRKPTESMTIIYEQSRKLVPWQTDNEYVLLGYRRQLHTIKACLASAFTYVHNETVNIHSHLLGFLYFSILLPSHFTSTFPSFPFSNLSELATPVPPTLHDRVALIIFLLSAMTCLALSSWFHTVQCHSQATCDDAHRGDYIGIVILIVGSITPSLYYGFLGNLILQGLYIGGLLIAGTTSGYIVLSPHHRAHRWHRTLTFIALGLTAVIPVVHKLVTHGLDHSREQMSLDLVVLGGVCYIVGAVMYAARFPERLSPGTFDYFGSSHQIFHMFVLGGAGCHYAALRGMVWGRGMAVGQG